MLAASCRDSAVAPAPAAPSQTPSQSLAPATTLDQEIGNLINQVFPIQLQPAVHQGWTNIKILLQRTGPTGKPTLQIKLALNAFVAFMQANTARLTTALGEPREHALVRLVLDMELYVFNGPSTPPPNLSPTSDVALATVQPGSTTPVTIQTPTQHAGVQFPVGAVSEPTTVIVAQESTPYPANCSGPLVTTLCQYPQFYHFNVFPDKKLNHPAMVAICHVNTAAGTTRAPLADHERFLLAHDKPADAAAYAAGSTIVEGIEILPLVRQPGLTNCGTNTTGYSTASAVLHPPATWLGSVLQRGLGGVARVASAIGSLISPKELYAIDQGGGGLVDFFSNFAVVDPQSQPDIAPAPGFSVSAASVIQGSPVTVNAWSASNIGTATLASYTVAVVLATDSALTKGVVALGPSTSGGALIPGAFAPQPSQTVTIPSATAAGTYFIGVKLVSDPSFPEISTANNVVSARLAVTPKAYASCEAVHAANPNAYDGNYVLTTNGRSFTVFCAEMVEGPRREYLTLVNVGGNYNYASSFKPGKYGVRTSWTKLRLDPATLLVDIGDVRYATTSDPNLTGYRLSVGHASGCVSPYSTEGSANVDLTGTPFKMHSTLAAQGWNVRALADGTMFYEGEAKGTTVINSQTVAIQAGGYCGGTTFDTTAPNGFDDSYNLNGDYMSSAALGSNPIALQLEFITPPSYSPNLKPSTSPGFKTAEHAARGRHPR